jgi:hypothetical protein
MRNKMKINRISVLGSILGLAHVAFALWVHNQHYEGGWEYFPIAVIDFPVTLILVPINHFFGLPSWWGSYFIIGSAWWYLIGLWLQARSSK